MSNASSDFLKRKNRERMRVSVRFDEFNDRLGQEDHALSCFKVAVCEITEEEAWQRIMDRTRALLNKIKS